MSVNLGNDVPILRDLEEPLEKEAWWKCCRKRRRKEVVDEDDDLILADLGCWWRLAKIQWFWAELVLFLYMFCDFPMNLVNQKYTLEWITLYNWDDDLAKNISHDFNISDDGSASVCVINTSTPEYAFSQRNQRMSSYFGMLRMGVWVFPAMLSTLVLGSVSDKYGRKWAFIPPILGCFLAILGQICVVYFKGSILWLLILDFASGATGSFGCVILAGVAHVVGKTTTHNRLFRITILQLSLLAGSTASPFATGQAYEHLGATLTLAMTAVICGLNLVYCLLCMPAMKESRNPGLVVVDVDAHSTCTPFEPAALLPRENGSPPQPPPSSTTVSPASSASQVLSSADDDEDSGGLFRQISVHVRNTCSIYSSGSVRRRRGPASSASRATTEAGGGAGGGGTGPSLADSILASFSEMATSRSIDLSLAESHASRLEVIHRLRILICAFFIVITAYFDIIIMTLYELNAPLCWDPGTIGLYTGVLVAVAALGSMALAPLMERFSSHITVAIVCCLTSASYRFYLFFFVKDTRTMFYGVALNIFNMMLIPSVRTMMTLLVEPGRHGAVLGSISAVEILCCFLGSVIFSIFYSSTLFYSTATVFLVSASLYLIGAVIFLAYRIKYGTGSVVSTNSLQDILV